MVEETNEAEQLAGLELPEGGKAKKGKKKKKKKNKKRKYSMGLEEAQRYDRAMTELDRRILNAVLDGVREWEKGSNKSSKKKRDGGLMDAAKNSAKAYAAYAKRMSKLTNGMYPYDGDRVLEDLFRL